MQGKKKLLYAGRRNFLQLIMGSSFLVLTKPAPASKDITANEITGFARMFCENPGSRWLGHFWMEKSSCNVCIERHVEDLCIRLQKIPGARADKIESLFKQAIRDDFQQAMVVNIDGWILSKTEVELYALSARLV